MSRLMADMVTTANLYKANLVTVMTWEARKGRKGVGGIATTLTELSMWIVNAQAGRIPECDVFPLWYRVTTEASAVWDAWYAAQKHGEWELIQAWYDGLGLEEQAS